MATKMKMQTGGATYRKFKNESERLKYVGDTMKADGKKIKADGKAEKAKGEAMKLKGQAMRSAGIMKKSEGESMKTRSAANAFSALGSHIKNFGVYKKGGMVNSNAKLTTAKKATGKVGGISKAPKKAAPTMKMGGGMKKKSC
jgi:hypothetical protein